MIRKHQASHSHSHGHRSGSYSSTSPAGGRPAAGLSRRRTQFRGPPPSFYRSGGWGAHSAKRAAAQENGAPGSEKPDENVNANSNATSGMGGMGPGQMGWGHGDEVPHFDKEGHSRTHEMYERRRRQKMDEEYGPTMQYTGMLGQFLLVGAVVSLGVFVPTFLLGNDSATRPPRPLKKEDP